MPSEPSEGIRAFHIEIEAIPELPDAACVGVDPELFAYVLDGEQAGPRDDRHRAALAVCGRCSAVAACDAWASSLTALQLHGVVGGAVRKPPIYKSIGVSK